MSKKQKCEGGHFKEMAATHTHTSDNMEDASTTLWSIRKQLYCDRIFSKTKENWKNPASAKVPYNLPLALSLQVTLSFSLTCHQPPHPPHQPVCKSSLPLGIWNSPALSANQKHLLRTCDRPSISGDSENFPRNNTYKELVFLTQGAWSQTLSMDVFLGRISGLGHSLLKNT